MRIRYGLRKKTKKMNKIEKLKTEYSNIYSKEENRPSWAVKKIENKNIVYPSIPFIGNNYDETRILLYASAENLKDYDGWLDDDNLAANRHRIWFDKHSGNSFFPNVHIAPINNGGLVNIIGYVTMKTQPNFQFNNPRELLEGVALANFGKFSIDVEIGDKNIDYARDYNKLSKSLSYIKADLNILKPKVLIIPETIYNHHKIRKLLKTEFPEINIIPIYQLHHFNINHKNRLKKFKRKNQKEIGILANWQTNFGAGLTGETSKNFYSFYTYLDEKMKNF